MNITIEDLKEMINEFTEIEFDETYLFHEYPLDKLPIMHSTVGDDEVMLELFFDIVNLREYYYADGELIQTIQHNNAGEMYEVNAGCNFDDMYRACVDAYTSHSIKQIHKLN